MTEFIQPIVGRRTETDSYRFLDTLTHVHISAEETDGRCSVVEMRLREGHAPPMHIHQKADETVHVLDGMVTAHTPEETYTVTADETAVLPRGQEHSLVADEQSVVLITTTPGGFDEFVTAVGEPTDDEVVPTEPPSEEAIGRVTNLAAEHNIEIVGPPPVGP